MTSVEISDKVRDFVLFFMEKHGSLINNVARKYLIPNRYTTEDIKQYISERVIHIMTARLTENTNPIENPEKYFKSCLDFYCIEYQRMHGYIFDLPKRPRKNCEDDEKAAKAWGFKYLGDITIDEYNSVYEYTLDRDLTENQVFQIEHESWRTITGCLTEAEANVMDCIHRRNMTWTETADELGVAQSTCWFRKGKATMKILGIFSEMHGDISCNIRKVLRGDPAKLGEFIDAAQKTTSPTKAKSKSSND